jgi:hypothetical protein
VRPAQGRAGRLSGAIQARRTLRLFAVTVFVVIIVPVVVIVIVVVVVVVVIIVVVVLIILFVVDPALGLLRLLKVHFGPLFQVDLLDFPL